MLPNTPMLATASRLERPDELRRPTCCRFATICGAWLTRSTWNPSAASCDPGRWVSRFVSWSSNSGASWMNWLIDEARVADAWTRIAEQHDDDREVDDDHRARLAAAAGSARTTPR